MKTHRPISPSNAIFVQPTRRRRPPHSTPIQNKEQEQELHSPSRGLEASLIFPAPPRPTCVTWSPPGTGSRPLGAGDAPSYPPRA